MIRKSRRLGAILSPTASIASRASTTSGRAHRPLAVLGAGLLAVGLAGLSGGCEFQTDLQEGIANIHPKRTDLIATGQVKGQAVSGPGIVVSLPIVFRENDDLVVSGTVTRQAGDDAPVQGFLEMRVIGPDDKLLDESLLHWVPEQIPTAGPRAARYHGRVLGNPPAGSTVRVAYIEKVSDLESYDAPSAGGGSAGGHGAASHVGGHGHR